MAYKRSSKGYGVLWVYSITLEVGVDEKKCPAGSMVRGRLFITCDRQRGGGNWSTWPSQVFRVWDGRPTNAHRGRRRRRELTTYYRRYSPSSWSWPVTTQPASPTQATLPSLLSIYSFYPPFPFLYLILLSFGTQQFGPGKVVFVPCFKLRKILLGVFLLLLLPSRLVIRLPLRVLCFAGSRLTLPFSFSFCDLLFDLVFICMDCYPLGLWCLVRTWNWSGYCFLDLICLNLRSLLFSVISFLSLLPSIVCL